MIPFFRNVCSGLPLRKGIKNGAFQDFFPCKVKSLSMMHALAGWLFTLIANGIIPRCSLPETIFKLQSWTELVATESGNSSFNMPNFLILKGYEVL